MLKQVMRISWLVIILIGLGWTFSGEVCAQKEFPTKSIKVVVGYGPGGTTDLSTRALSKGASKFLGKPVTVMNTPGGGGTVALTNLMAEKPDGYSLVILGTGSISAQYMRSVPFKVLQDFTPIVQFCSYYTGLVVQTDSPWKNFKEFVDFAKANPGKIRYGTAGPGLPQHLVMERLAYEQNIKWAHVPFGGGLEAVTALMGGHLEAVSGVTEWKPFVDSGKLRLLVTYGTKRMPNYPDVPTLTDLGYNIARAGFNGVVGPKGMSSDRVEILAKAFKEGMEGPEYLQVMKQFDMIAEFKSPKEFVDYLKELDKETEMLIQRAGLMKK